MHYAARAGWREIVQCLLEQGALVAMKTKMSDTALHLAAEAGHLKVTLPPSHCLSSALIPHYLASLNYAGAQKTPFCCRRLSCSSMDDFCDLYIVALFPSK